MRVILGLTLAGTVLVAGCDGCNENKAGPDTNATAPSASASAASPETAASASAGRPDRHGSRGRGGATAMLLFSARSLDITTEQKAKLDELEKKLTGDDASPRDEMKDVHEALIAGVKAGKIDQAKLEPLLAQIEKAAKDRQDKEAEVMNGIHAALLPEQRVSVVKDIRAKQAAREERMARRGGGADGGRAGYDASRWQKQRVARMTKELDLDDAQQKKVEAALPPAGKGSPDARADAKKRMDEMLAAFEKDDFDAKKLGGPDPKHARAPLEQEAKFIAAILPILKPEQREKLAATMDRGGKGSHGRRGGDHQRPAVGGGADVDDDDDDG